MGYYTKFELESVSGATINEVMDFIVQEVTFDPFESEWKWYSHIEDMRKISLNFPDAVIVTSGIGEEYPDLWKCWFKNGDFKKARAVITFTEPQDYDNKNSNRW